MSRKYQFFKRPIGRGGSTRQVHMQSPSTDEYKQAVWDFLMEHCDITDRGSFFVKFHTSGRFDFEKRVNARLKYGYHRVDERTGFTNSKKEMDAELRRAAHISEKQSKKRRYILARDERLKALAELEAKRKVEQMSVVERFIHKASVQPLAQLLYNKCQVWLKKHRQKKSQSSKSSSANTATLSQ